MQLSHAHNSFLPNLCQNVKRCYFGQNGRCGKAFFYNVASLTYEWPVWLLTLGCRWLRLLLIALFFQLFGFALAYLLLLAQGECE